MTYTVHRLAEQDLAKIFRFYKKEAGSKVALRFLDEFERIAELLDANLGLGTPTNEDRRIFPFKVYRYYSLLYKPVEDGIRILAVSHQRRGPNYGANRN